MGVMLVLVIVMASVLVAATQATDTELRHQEAMIRSTLAKDVARYFTEQVQAEPATLTDNPFMQMMQEFYDARSADPNAVFQIDNTKLQFKTTDTSLDNLWIIDDSVITVELKLKNLQFNVTQAYKDEVIVDPVDPSNPLNKPAVPEKCTVKASMDAVITVEYHDKQFTLTAQYRFNGETFGNSKGGGKLVNGECSWTLLGYQQ